jgi:hypothetical protein
VSWTGANFRRLLEEAMIADPPVGNKGVTVAMTGDQGEAEGVLLEAEASGTGK